MGKIKGNSIFNYNSLKSQITMHLSKAQSTNYEIDFSSYKYTNTEETLADVADKKNIYIGTIIDNGIKNKNIYDAVPRHFNSLTCENAMKWGRLSNGEDISEYNFEDTDEIEQFAIANNVSLRGHTLVWGRMPGHSYPMIINNIIATSSTPKQDLKSILDNHIKTMITRYKDTVRTWDVVNEPYEVFGSKLAPYMFYQVLGKDYIKNAFISAGKYRTNEKLLLNEQFFHYKDQRAKNFIELLKELIGQGVPIDVVGLQHHVMFNEPKYDDLKWFLDEVCGLGLRFELTELDVRQNVFKRSKNQSLSQAQCYYNIAKLCSEYDEFDGLTIWGLDDKHCWYDLLSPFNKDFMGENKALLFNEEFSKKPSYYGLLHGIK